VVVKVTDWSTSIPPEAMEGLGVVVVGSASTTKLPEVFVVEWPPFESMAYTETV
jgi:hypothetical protein